MTAPAIETTEITLEDIAPGCAYTLNAASICPHLAEWVMVATCGCVYFFCTPHKEAQEKLRGVTDAANVPWGVYPRVYCRHCRTDFDGSPWASVERL